MSKIFTPGTVTTVLDAQYGSTAKGVISSHLVKHHRPTILMTANGRNSSHTVVDANSRMVDGDIMSAARVAGKFVFKVLPCGAFYNGMMLAETPVDDNTVRVTYWPKFWIGPGAAFQVEDLLAEMDACDVRRDQVLIHPMASIVTDGDIAYENGASDFDGVTLAAVDHDSGTTRHGTTGSGAGAARARKALRKGVVARDEPQLADMLARPSQILAMLEAGATALLDGSQGYLLSLYGVGYPHCTSRSTTLASFFAECDLPPSVIGHVCAVARCLPIRIASKRYFSPVGQRFLTWTEVQEYRELGKAVEEIDSNSGGWYPDQEELTWEQVSEQAGQPIAPEYTTLTKLQRRIATWSDLAMTDFLLANKPPAPHGISLYLTFVNYLNPDIVAAKLGNLLANHGSRIAAVFISDSPDADSVRLAYRSYKNLAQLRDSVRLAYA
jgi:adenylosuccinate synthase